MLNKLSFNLAKELNESETRKYKIKKKVLIESNKVKIEELDESSPPEVRWDDYDDYSEEEIEKINNLLDNVNLVAIKHEGNKDDGYSVAVKDNNSGLVFWMDYSKSGQDIYGDWNQYIFFTNDYRDRIKRAMQSAYTDDWSFFMDVEDVGMAYLLDHGLVSDSEDGMIFESCKSKLSEYKEEGVKYNIYLLLGGDGVYNSKLVDTVDSLEQAQDKVTELQAENECNAYYEKVDKNGKPLEESSKLNEGAGAGYHITGTIETATVKSFNIINTEIDKYGVPTYELECDIEAYLEDVYFESYEYGGHVDLAQIQITYLVLTDNHDPEEKGELNETNISQSLVGTNIKNLVGDGWIHSTFTGELEGDDNADGSVYTDFYTDAVGYRFVDEELIKYIDLAVIGENRTEEYIVYSEDDELERFDSEEEAIEYAKNNPEAYKVEELSYRYEFDGDIDINSEYSEIVWEKEEPDND